MSRSVIQKQSYRHAGAPDRDRAVPWLPERTTTDEIGLTGALELDLSPPANGAWCGGNVHRGVAE